MKPSPAPVTVPLSRNVTAVIVPGPIMVRRNVPYASANAARPIRFIRKAPFARLCVYSACFSSLRAILIGEDPHSFLWDPEPWRGKEFSMVDYPLIVREFDG